MISLRNPPESALPHLPSKGQRTWQVRQTRSYESSIYFVISFFFQWFIDLIEVTLDRNKGCLFVIGQNRRSFPKHVCHTTTCLFL